jgi:hypothetical protein
MNTQRLKRWGAITLEWALRTLNEIAGNLASLR